MCEGGEVEVWMQGTQGCLVACVWTEPGTEKGVLTCKRQPDVALEYRTHWMHWAQCAHYESQDAILRYQTQDGLLLMYLRRYRYFNWGLVLCKGQSACIVPTQAVE